MARAATAAIMGSVRLFRLLVFVAIVWGAVWAVRNYPIGGRTLWERVTGEAGHVKHIADGVEKKIGNPNVTERLRPEERREVREIIKEKTQ